MTRFHVLLAALLLVLAGCGEEAPAARPKAVTLNADALGHYCQMNVIEHEGPKAQIHLAGNPNPVWFTQVRDAVAFTRLPEEPKDYVAIYVNDMGKAPSWASPGEDNWIEARDAYFVIESTRRGSMGAAEAVPFGTREGADAFAAANGGRVVRFDDIPTEYVLAISDTGGENTQEAGGPVAAGAPVPAEAKAGARGPDAHDLESRETGGRASGGHDGAAGKVEK